MIGETDYCIDEYVCELDKMDRLITKVLDDRDMMMHQMKVMKDMLVGLAILTGDYNLTKIRNIDYYESMGSYYKVSKMVDDLMKSRMG